MCTDCRGVGKVSKPKVRAGRSIGSRVYGRWGCGGVALLVIGIVIAVSAVFSTAGPSTGNGGAAPSTRTVEVYGTVTCDRADGPNPEGVTMRLELRSTAGSSAKGEIRVTGTVSYWARAVSEFPYLEEQPSWVTTGVEGAVKVDLLALTLPEGVERSGSLDGNTFVARFEVGDRPQTIEGVVDGGPCTAFRAEARPS